MFGRGSKNEPDPPEERTLAQKVSCVFCLLYAVVAVAAIPVIFQLLRRDMHDDGNGTITIAIKACRPKNVEYDFNGESVSVDVDEDDEFACKGVGFLVFATVASLVVSATTSVIYAYKDVRSIPRKGTLNLMFILLQSGLVTTALLSEVVFWENSYQEVLKSYSDGRKVRAPGSKVLIGLACALSFTACLSLTFRKVKCSRPPAKAPEESTKPAPAPAPAAEPQPKQKVTSDVEAMEDNPPSWAKD